MYVPTETTTGGNALKYYASVYLNVRRIETLKKDNVEYGNRIKIKVVKNKVETITSNPKMLKDEAEE